jgi:hypothetical protein
LEPSPTIHLNPNLTELTAHIKPLKNLEVATELQLKMLGSLVLYFASMTDFHSFPSLEEYLLSQEARRQMFTEGFRSIVNQKISYGSEQESQDLI